MMGITTPILLIVLIVGICYLAIKWTNLKKKSRAFSYVKRVRWIFGGYAAILLIGAITAAFIPEQRTHLGKKVNTEALQKDDSDLYTDALEGKIANLDSKWKRKAWSFKYHEKRLNIVGLNDGTGNVLIVAERKGVNDNQIEAAYYQTRSALNNREFKQLLPSPNLELAGNQLTILQKTEELDYSQLTNVFPIRQFTGEPLFNDQGSPLYEGQGILFLRIPKAIQLTHQENLNIEYVKKTT